MSYEIHADYSQQWLLPPALDDWVTGNHPARFVREFVETLDLTALGFRQRVALDGRPNYAADLLLKIWLYGYITGVRRARDLEQACHGDVAMMWLAGLHRPDHNTLWRFWDDHRTALRKLFKAVVHVAVRSGLVGVVLHAVDGTKIAAHGSIERVRKAGQLKAELAALEEAVEEVVAQIDALGERTAQEPGYELPTDWRAQLLRREEIRELVGELETTGRGTIHAGEREAHLMKTRAGGLRPAYNAQAVVDSTSGLIVAADVLTEEADNHALVPMLEQVKETLGTGAAETAADGGYHSGEQLATCEERQYSVVVNQSAQNVEHDAAPGATTEFAKSQFTYDAVEDCCICPQDQRLRYLRTRIRQRGNGGMAEEIRVYRCTVFRTCPVRWACSPAPRGRTVTIGRFHEAVRRQREKLNRPEKRLLLTRRRGIIEPVFGFIKEGFGFRRFTVAGTEKVRTQWAMICTAVDLRKLYALWSRGLPLAWA